MFLPCSQISKSGRQHSRAAFAKVLLLVGVAYVVSRFVLPHIFRFVARQPELALFGAWRGVFPSRVCRLAETLAGNGRADRRRMVSTFRTRWTSSRASRVCAIFL